jgi:hypothetical protein
VSQKDEGLPDSVRGLLEFFRAAGIDAAVDNDMHLVLRGRTTNPTFGDLSTLPATVGRKSPAWQNVVDRLVVLHASNNFSRAVTRNARLAPGLTLAPHGSKKYWRILHGEELIAAIHPTRVKLLGRQTVYGNFLTAGPHWDLAASAYLEQGAVEPELSKLKQVAADQANDAQAKQHQKPASAWNSVPKAPVFRRIDPLPDYLPDDFTDPCLRASYQIRHNRQQAYDGPVVLESSLSEITLFPIVGVPTQLRVPFKFHFNSRNSLPVWGELLLEDVDPVPALIEETVSDETAIMIWAYAIIGFADATCFKRVAMMTSHEPIRSSNGSAHFAVPRRSSGSKISDRPWPRHLQPTGLWTQYSGAYVAAHRRSLSDDQTPSDEARELALQIGITLKPHETWVRAHTRGVPKGIEMRFRWTPPKSLASLRLQSN